MSTLSAPQPLYYSVKLILNCSHDDQLMEFDAIFEQMTWLKGWFILDVTQGNYCKSDWGRF